MNSPTVDAQVVHHAAVYRDGELLLDLERHGLDVLRIEARAGEHPIQMFVPLPQTADDWVARLIADAVAWAVSQTVEALTS